MVGTKGAALGAPGWAHGVKWDTEVTYFSFVTVGGGFVTSRVSFVTVGGGFVNFSGQKGFVTSRFAGSAVQERREV